MAAPSPSLAGAAVAHCTASGGREFAEMLVGCGIAAVPRQPAHTSLWLRPDTESGARNAALRQTGHDE